MRQFIITVLGGIIALILYWKIVDPNFNPIKFITPNKKSVTSSNIDSQGVVKKQAYPNKKDRPANSKIEHKSIPAKGDVCIQCRKIHPKKISLNKSEGFCNNEIFITLKSINEKNEIDAIVHSSGSKELIINKGAAGKTYTYISNDEIYEIRIMGVEYKDEIFKDFASAEFLVEIK